MRGVVGTLFVLALSVCGTARAQVAAEKLGEAYAQAEPAEKLVMIAVARQDKVFTPQENPQKDVDELYLGEVNKGKSSEEKLKLLGALRKTVEEKLKAKAEERKAAGVKNPHLSSVDPDGVLQTAIADSYVVDAAGPKPTLEALGCLALVRECTAWTAHGALTLALVMDALDRDETWLGADHEGKLKIVKTLTEDKQMLSTHEQTVLEKGVVADWMNGQLKEGKSPKDVKDALEPLYKRKVICFFTWSWAQGILERMARVR